jgi:hypothetical protein
VDKTGQVPVISLSRTKPVMEDSALDDAFFVSVLSQTRLILNTKAVTESTIGKKGSGTIDQRCQQIL